MQEPELSLKQISASSLGEIAKHCPELAQNVVDCGAVPLLAKSFSNVDVKFKVQSKSNKN